MVGTREECGTRAGVGNRHVVEEGEGVMIKHSPDFPRIDITDALVSCSLALNYWYKDPIWTTPVFGVVMLCKALEMRT